jgi:bacillolysin
MKTHILFILLFVAVIQTYAQNEPSHAEITNGCISPTGLTASGVTQHKATISWSKVAGATSYNLEYESVGVWTGIFVTGTSYTLTGLTGNTTYSYHVLAVCSGGYSAYSAQSYFTTTGNVNNCSSKGNSTKLEFIKRVKLDSINNLSGDNGGYKNYASLSVTLLAGHAYTIKLTPGFHVLPNTEYWTVYIDYNRNNSFADAGELVFTESSSALLTGVLTMPSSFANGASRMRIQMHYGSAITNPCAKFDYGEVEDYTVNLSGSAGFTEFSGSDNLDNAESTASTQVSVSPNPVKGFDATVTYNVTETGSVTLTMFDIYGRVIKTFNPGFQSAGIHSYKLNHIAYLPGNYFIKVTQGKELIGEAKIIVAN